MTCDHEEVGRLLPYPEALALVLAHIHPLGSETVVLAESLGACLAEPAVALHHSPRFEQAAMDGYAVRMADVASASPDAPVTLTLTGELPAGDQSLLTLRTGETIKVFTGSRLPAGTDAVVMQEFVELRGDQAAVAWTVDAGDHIRRVGEEFRRGEEIMPVGTRITPPVVGMLAFLGRKSVAVGRRPSALVITIGDELVAPGEKPGPGQVNDANGPAVVAALHAAGLRRVRHLLVPDDPAVIGEALAEGLAEADLVLTVGGASVGDHDHVHAARAGLGLHEVFDRVAIKPGKPTLFGVGADGTPVFGLPGNPVSALVACHQLVLPAVVRLMGGLPRGRRRLPVVVPHSLAKQKGRLNWLRATLALGEVDGSLPVAVPLAGQGSHMLSGLAAAEVLVEIPAASDGVGAGEPVAAVLLDWFN